MRVRLGGACVCGAALLGVMAACSPAPVDEGQNASPMRSFSAPGALPVDVGGAAERRDARTAVTAEADAAVYLAQPAGDGIVLEQVASVEEAGTRVPLVGASSRHGLALVSRYGHVVKRAALAGPSQEQKELVRARAVASARAWRPAERLSIGDDSIADDPTAGVAAFERSEAVAKGDELPVVAYAPSRAHGTLFITEFGDDITFADARHVELGDTRILDSRHYSDRLAMVSRLKESFAPVQAPEESPWAGHPYDGLEVQTSWQQASGRAFADDRGYASGWWQADNYTLTVWPFLVAKRKLGAFPDTHVIVPSDPRYAIPEEARSAWRASLEHFQASRDDLSASALAEEARRSQQLLWEAHSDSLQIAIERNQDLERELPEAERTFALAFGSTAVEFMAAVNVPSDELIIGTFNDLLLPAQVLSGDEIGDPEQELSAQQVFVLRRVRDLHRYEVENDYEILELVRSAMEEVSPDLRDRAHELLRSALTDTSEDDIISAIVGAFL